MSTITQLITHAKPHVDDLAALWILKTYHPLYHDADIVFLQKTSEEPTISADAIAIGIGKGQFDEHKGDIGESATSLVWKWLLVQPEVKLEKYTSRALERLVSWVHKEDLAELKPQAWWEWSITVPLEYSWEIYPDEPQKVYDLAAEVFRSTMWYYESIAPLDDDWDKRIEFESKWGKAIALESSSRGLSERAWQHGAVMVIQLIPDGGLRQFRARVDSPVNFSDTYEKVRAHEPFASWFLHHEKRMLLCGSRTASQITPSQLTLEQMIALVKK